MNKNLSPCKYLAILALLSNAAAFIIILYLSKHAEDIIESPLREKLNLAIVVTMILCWLGYVLSSRCYVKRKKQNKILEGIGMLGPIGLFFALLLPDLSPIVGKVKVIDNSSLKGPKKIFYWLFGFNKYKYIDPSDLVPREIIETMNAESIQVKTVDGKIVNLWTLKKDKTEENTENDIQESGHLSETNGLNMPDSSKY